jgi:hypothetical protein
MSSVKTNIHPVHKYDIVKFNSRWCNRPLMIQTYLVGWHSLIIGTPSSSSELIRFLQSIQDECGVAFLNSSTFCGEFQHWWTVNHKFFFVLNIYVVQKCDE